MKNYCLITGASGGIGLEFARVFAKNGYNLILVARSNDKLKCLKKELETRYSIKAVAYSADLTSCVEIEQLHKYVIESNLQVDILVNNAGFGDLCAFLDSKWDRQQALIELNITALVKLTYLFGSDMRKRGAGRIINLSSVAAFSAGPYMSLYYASKSFVLSFSEALAAELDGTGISVTALCPGPTSTGFEKNAHMGKSVMFSRFKTATAKDVAETGYRAAMRGKSIKYHGFVTNAFNIATRLLPRRITRKMAAGMNKT
jgi:short-subunit dehydrogenase